jgi:hypothetical protein
MSVCTSHRLNQFHWDLNASPYTVRTLVPPAHGSFYLVLTTRFIAPMASRRPKDYFLSYLIKRIRGVSSGATLLVCPRSRGEHILANVRKRGTAIYLIRYFDTCNRWQWPSILMIGVIATKGYPVLLSCSIQILSRFLQTTNFLLVRSRQHAHHYSW